jgi:hypothetical protein
MVNVPVDIPIFLKTRCVFGHRASPVRAMPRKLEILSALAALRAPGWTWLKSQTRAPRERIGPRQCHILVNRATPAINHVTAYVSALGPA